jgi:hypothetical protein
MSAQLSQLCQQYLCHSLRTYMYNHFHTQPWRLYIQLFYNDALTYDPVSKTGGLKANFIHPHIARDRVNVNLQGLA